MRKELRPAGQAPDVEKYLYQSINESQVYHNQKERMAWLSLGLYGVSAAATNTAFASVQKAVGQGGWITSSYVVLSLALAILFLNFMRQQLGLRALAAALSTALRAATIQMLERGEVPSGRAFDRTLGQQEHKAGMIRYCPDFVYQHFRSQKDGLLNSLMLGQYAIFAVIFAVSVGPVIIIGATSEDGATLLSWFSGVFAPNQ